MYMKQPCIILEGAVCQGEYAACRLNCPRAIPSYWREIWLERVFQPADANEAHDKEMANKAMAKVRLQLQICENDRNEQPCS
jgi:hypothetical protein